MSNEFDWENIHFHYWLWRYFWWVSNANWIGFISGKPFVLDGTNCIANLLVHLIRVTLLILEADFENVISNVCTFTETDKINGT